MKKVLFLATIAVGFVFVSKAQTVTTTGNDNKPKVETTTQPTVVTNDTLAQNHKQCAGHGTSQCKQGTAKSCCKGKTGEATGSTTPTTGATATPSAQTGGTAAGSSEHKCGGGSCCKKKTGQKSGS